MIGRGGRVLLCGFVALAANASSRAEDGAVFRSKEWGLSVRYPAGLTASTTFKPNAFDRGAWRVSYAAGVGPGTPLVAIALPDLHAEDAGGTSVAMAELRIGASRDPAVLATCLTYGVHSGDDVEQTTRGISGIVFTEIPDNGDGHAGQRIASDDLRAVHDGTCWAIDLVRYRGGSSNKIPEHTHAQIDCLRHLLDEITID